MSNSDLTADIHEAIRALIRVDKALHQLGTVAGEAPLTPRGLADRDDELHRLRMLASVAKSLRNWNLSRTGTTWNPPSRLWAEFCEALGAIDR